jgi:hypothetical protein
VIKPVDEQLLGRIRAAQARRGRGCGTLGTITLNIDATLPIADSELTT